MNYWSVAQTIPMRETIAAEQLDRRGVQTYLPKIKNRAREIEPLFPTYLFVRIEVGWPIINQTVGVQRVLLSCDRPALIGENIITEIRCRENPAGLVRLPDLEPRRGARVRIIRGSFCDHVGIWQGQSNKDRERVLLLLLGRMVPIAVPMRHLEFEVATRH